MSARSPFDLLGFADFGELLTDYQRKARRFVGAAAATTDERDAARAWQALEACGRRYGVAEQDLAVLR